ncbi:MAG: aspartyl protease family protein [Opitutaceae bacterium]|nr:aspartyl protease family protein [Opitutaceae bacterium]
MRDKGPTTGLRSTLATLLLAVLVLSGCNSLPFSTPPAIEATDLPRETVVIPARRVGNLLLIEAQWDKRGPWRFIVDTGSSVTLVSSEFASRYAISRKRFVSAPKRVRLATGTERLFPNTVIREFRFGEASFINKPVLVFDASELSAQFGVKIDGILGFPFFGESRIELDYGQPQLRISRSVPDTGRPPEATSYRLEMRTPRITGTLGGSDREFLIDSGSDVAVVLPILDPTLRFSIPIRPGGALGSLSGSTQSLVGRIDGDFAFANHIARNPVVTFGGTESSIGGGILSLFTVVFDTREKWVALVSAGASPLTPTSLRHAGLSFTKTPAYWRVDAVVPGSNAETAGVRVGDLVVRINGEPVSRWPLARFDAHVRRAEELVYTFLHGTRERPATIPPFDLVPTAAASPAPVQ